MEKTWKPTTAGILSIIAGAMGLIVGTVIALLGGAFAWLLGLVPMVPDLLTLSFIPLIILGIVAIVGGIYALRRRVWGLALAGAICAFLIPPPITVLGILAIIFVAMGKGEFE